MKVSMNTSCLPLLWSEEELPLNLWYVGIPAVAASALASFAGWFLDTLPPELADTTSTTSKRRAGARCRSVAAILLFQRAPSLTSVRPFAAARGRDGLERAFQ